MDVRDNGSNDDVLPTRFYSRTQSRVSGGSKRYVSESPLPVKRTRRSRGRVTLSFANTADHLSAIHESSTQLRTPRTRSRTRGTSTMGRIDRDHDQGPSPSRSSASPTHHRPRRMDGVGIFSEQRSQGHPRTACDVFTSENPHKSTSSYHPSPPVSCASKGLVHDSGSFPIVEPDDSVSPDTTLPLKTSKYFACVPSPLTQSVSERLPVLTPTSSPILTIPVCIESSDFEYPLLDASLDDPVEDPVNDPGYLSSWHDNLGLFDDLMIMLRHLKPILIQESVRDDPWKVLIAARLLNVTTGKAAIPVFCKILSRWPTPQNLLHAPHDELVELLRPLGLYNKRASWLKDVSEYFFDVQEGQSCSKTDLVSFLSAECTKVPVGPRLNYPGVGPYALDSLRIFCTGDKDTWQCVMPRDKELVRYLVRLLNPPLRPLIDVDWEWRQRWRWAVEERKVWYPGGMGVIGDVDVPYLITLVDELATWYDSTIGGEGYMYHFCNDLCDVLTGNETG